MDEELFDPELIRPLREETGDLFGALVDLYATEVPAQVTLLRDALSAADLATAARVAHTLKGTAANFGARRMQELANRVFNLAQQGSAAGIPAVVELLDQECGRVGIALAELREV